MKHNYSLLLGNLYDKSSEISVGKVGWVGWVQWCVS